ncbi:MAG: tRNA uridine-5-carboxymethylaminomethyl(34) synthesis GTPase MnmE [Chitinophagaceae bacterium]
MNKILSWDDTIAALSTPPGISAISVIRISGNKAFEIVDQIFPSKNLLQQSSHSLHVGFLKYNDVFLDEVVVSLFKNPKSYTGEDLIEISCHGSPFIQQQILQTLIQCGARTATQGEFTQRAFLNGKLDLAQAEAVADLIASNSESAKKTALQQMRGGFSDDLKNIREQLLKFSALIELELDFSQEDVEFVNKTQLHKLLFDAKEKIDTLLQSFRLGNVIKNGVQVAIIGKPNSGKSTLLNTLLNEERAIVSEIAGTTRDTIEETMNINGILFKLIDTAGIREHTTDVIENMGVERSLQKMRNANIILYLFDVNATTEKNLEEIILQLNKENINYLLVGNKADDLPNQSYLNEAVIYISAKEKKNIDLLKQVLFNAAVKNESISDQTIITNARHVMALEKILQSLNDVIAGLKDQLPGDLLSLDIKRCLYYLGEITGEITNEEQLDYIFSKFCIGK